MGAPCIVKYTSDLLKEEAQKITDRFNELVKGGLSSREAGIKVATEQHKVLHDELNTFKKSIGVNPTAYTSFDNSKEIQAVHDKYNPLIESKKIENTSKALDDLKKNDKQKYLELQKISIGYSDNEIRVLKTDELSINKNSDDLKIAKQNQKKSGLSEKEWAQTIDLSKPIEAVYQDGNIVIEDGHNRYLAAKILDKSLKVFTYTPNDKVLNNYISEAYHKDKASGKETKLTKAVEDALSTKTSNPLIESAKQKASEVIPENKVPDPEEEKIITEKVVDKPIGESGEGKDPPVDDTIKIPIGDGKETIGITHAEFKKVGDELGLPDYEKTPQTLEQWHQEADARIAKGEMPKVIEKMNNGDIPTEVEQFMIAKYVAGLKDEYNKTGSDEVLKEIYKVKQLSDKMAGSAWGKAGRARQEMMPVQPLDGGLASAMVAKMEANNTDVLTEQQKAEVKKQVEDYKIAAENEKKLREEIEAKHAELLAQSELNKTNEEARKSKSKSASNGKKTSEDFTKERKDILKDAVEKIKAARDKANDPNAPKKSGIGGRTWADDLFTIAPEVLKLTKSYLEEGVGKLADIIEKAHKELKDSFPEISKEDIRDIIAGKYNKRVETKNELQAKWYDIQQEQKLLNEYDRVNAKEAKTERQQRDKNEILTKLRDKINEKKKENKLDQYSDEAKLKALIKSNENAANKIQDRIKSKDFSPEKLISFIENFELRKKYPELYNKVLNAINKKEEAKHEFELELARDEMAKQDKVSQLVSGFNKVKNTLQSIVAGVDDSMMFVQLGWTLLNNPSVAFKVHKYTDANGRVRHELGGAIKEHLLDAWDKNRFDKQMTVLHNSPLWSVIQTSGLDVLEPQSLHAIKKEEMFQHSYADKVGFGTINMGKALSLGDSQLKRANLGKFLQIFERAYTSLGNNVRVDLFIKQSKVLYNQGMTIENNLNEFKGLAKAINNLTGRGTTTAEMAKVIPFVTPIIWSPKMIASSINLLGLSDVGSLGKHGFYSKLPPKARAYAVKQMVQGIGIAASALTAAALGGYVVHHDPRDPKFGDIDYGKDDSLSINVFGRYAGMIKLVANLFPGFLGGGRMDKSGKVISTYDKGGKTAAGTVGGFLRGKMNPVSGLLYDKFANDNQGYYNHKPIDLTTAASQLVVPMALQNVRTELDRDGIISIFNYTLPNFVGLSMKDKRDYDNNPLFTSDKLKSDDFKILEDKGIEALQKGTIGKYHISVDKNHADVSKLGAKPHAIMTQDEFDKFNIGRAEAYPKILKEALSQKYNVDKKSIKGAELDKKYNYKIKDYIEARMKSVNRILKSTIIDD